MEDGALYDAEGPTSGAPNMPSCVCVEVRAASGTSRLLRTAEAGGTGGLGRAGNGLPHGESSFLGAALSRGHMLALWAGTL